MQHTRDSRLPCLSRQTQQLILPPLLCHTRTDCRQAKGVIANLGLPESKVGIVELDHESEGSDIQVSRGERKLRPEQARLSLCPLRSGCSHILSPSLFSLDSHRPTWLTRPASAQCPTSSSMASTWADALISSRPSSPASSRSSLLDEIEE